MESRIDIQEKVEQIIDAVDGMKGRQIPIPGKHLLCLLYGELGDSSHEIRKQLEHNLRRRYVNANTYHILHMERLCSRKMDELLVAVRKSVENGYVPRTNICYIPVLFLVEDPGCRKLPGFIEELRTYFSQDGTFQCRIDLYGLIDFSKTECADNWQVLCPGIGKMVHKQMDDLYFCSKDGMALNHIFSQAVDAIEMNMFMKVSLPERDFRDFWKVDLNSAEQVKSYACNWKCISYWKMDILVCTVCQYILEMIDFQIGGTRGESYRSEVKQKIRDFFYYELESKGLENLCLSMPVPLYPLKELVDSTAATGFLKGIFKRAKETQNGGYTYGEIINKLYGDDSFFEVFAQDVIVLDDEAIYQLKETLLGGGTFRDISEQLQLIVQEHLEEAKKEKEIAEDKVEALKGTRLNVQLKDVESFLKSVNQELLLAYCSRYQSRERYKVLNRLDGILESSAFYGEINRELAKHEDWKRFLNAIITSNLPQNEKEIKNKLAQTVFYDHKKDNDLCWRDDIFEILKKDDVFKQMIREIRENVCRFIETERDDIITIFKNGIKRIYDEADVYGSRAVDGLYVLKGVSYALEAKRKECLLANEDFLNLRFRKEEGYLEQNVHRMMQYSCETCYPFTLEFFGLNESINTTGIQGLHRREAGDDN